MPSDTASTSYSGVYGSQDRWSGTECPDLRGSPQILSAGFRHGFEVYRPKTNFCQQDSNYLRQGPEDIDTFGHCDHYEVKGLNKIEVENLKSAVGSHTTYGADGGSHGR